MKKVIEMVVCCMLIVTLVGCKNAVTTNVKIDYGTSAIYTKEDMDSAIDTIKETFKSFEGCELYTLSYSSDDVCRDEEKGYGGRPGVSINRKTETERMCLMWQNIASPKLSAPRENKSKRGGMSAWSIQCGTSMQSTLITEG